MAAVAVAAVAAWASEGEAAATAAPAVAALRAEQPVGSALLEAIGRQREECGGGFDTGGGAARGAAAAVLAATAAVDVMQPQQQQQQQQQQQGWSQVLGKDWRSQNMPSSLRALTGLQQEECASSCEAEMEMETERSGQHGEGGGGGGTLGMSAASVCRHTAPALAKTWNSPGRHVSTALTRMIEQQRMECDDSELSSDGESGGGAGAEPLF